MKIEVHKAKREELKRFDIIHIECYKEEAFGFIDQIDEDSIIIKTGFGRRTNFVAWWKDKPQIVKINIMIKGE